MGPISQNVTLRYSRKACQGSTPSIVGPFVSYKENKVLSYPQLQNQTSLQMFARDKRSSLFGFFVSDEEKKSFGGLVLLGLFEKFQPNCHQKHKKQEKFLAKKSHQERNISFIFFISSKKLKKLKISKTILFILFFSVVSGMCLSVGIEQK